MNKYYNTQEEIASRISKKLKEIIPNIKKTVLNILPFILIGIFNSESCVASDIANNLKDDFSLVQHDSVIKRIRRFFKNKLFNPYDFYDKIVRYVISTYKKKHEDNRVHIIFDHMFSKDKYTVFMITMRIGKTGIPLWFRCFKGFSSSEAFEEELLKEGLSYVSSLFDESFDLIFLADRGFVHISLLKHIESLGHTYCVRFKKNIKIFVYSEKEKHYIRYLIEDYPSYQFKSKFLNNVYITNEKHKVNIVISKKQGVEEPWIIVTNGDPKRAIKDYGYRFGGIETVFKNQKTNGFYLEKTVNASQKYFETEYTIACLGILFMTILGVEYAKNTKCYKNVKITTQKANKDKKRVRVKSLFSTGLTLFHLAFNSSRYIRLPIKFILYDM